MSTMATRVEAPQRRFGGFRQLLGAFEAASRLGWEVSSNWTHPMPFLVYTILRPVSVALILAFMYSAISGNRAGTSRYLAFLVVGAAFWSFVQNGLADFANGVAEDRQRYRMLKYVYIAPPHLYLYMLGRVGSQLVTAIGSVVIVLALAAFVLHIPIDVRRVDYPLVIGSSLIAFVAVTGLAMAFCMWLLATRDSYGYGEVFAAVLYIASGAIFPISVLPGWLATAAQASPLVYWLEAVRRGLLGADAIRMFPGLSDLDVMLRLVVTTAILLVVCHLMFIWGDRRSRQQGLIDRIENW